MGDKNRTLDRQRKCLIETLPPFDKIVRGTVFERRHTCGKDYCHCADGEKHRSFYLTVTLSPGETEQISLPRELVPEVRQWVENYQKLKEVLEDIYEINRKVIRIEREKTKRKRKKGGRA